MQENSITWKPVPGYEGFYEVSNCGLVRSVTRTIKSSFNANRQILGKLRTVYPMKDGYMRVQLMREHASRSYGVHRLVMMAFSPNQNQDALDVNHMDGNKQNNSLENLEWCTRGENHKHRYQVLGQKHSFVGRVGAMHPRSKSVIGINIKTGENVFYESASQAAKALGIGFSRICACARGSMPTYKGYIWKYGPEEDLAKLWSGVEA
jgi:hypothetical protein